MAALDWEWIQIGWGTAGGDAFSRLFEGMGTVEDIVAREVIQNSWDAAQRFKNEFVEQKLKGPAPKFKMVFEFRELKGNDKKDLLNAIHIDELKKRVSEEGYERLQITENETVIDQDTTKDPLKVLLIHDYGATGLRGDPTGPEGHKSDFFRAFGELGGNDRSVGGGAFGYGKSAFIRASKIRLVVAYSSFMPQKNDPRTRRLCGFLYWKGHGKYSGMALLGERIQGGQWPVSPAKDDLADAIAEKFSFDKRHAKDANACGTSLLIVDHSLDPDRLKDSIEKYWWPALETFRGEFDISILANGQVMRPQPAQNAWCKPFLRAFEIASDPNSPIAGANEWKSDWRAVRDEGINSGSMALVHCPGESEEIEYKNSLSHVALIRSPRMVIEYQGHAGANLQNAVKGVYIASPEADIYLRKTEPPAHDKWQTEIDASLGGDWQKVKRIVNSIDRKIRNAVQDFQKSLRPRQVRTYVDEETYADKLLSEIFDDSDRRKGPKSAKTRKKKIKRSTSTYVSECILRKKEWDGEGVSIFERWKVALPSSYNKDTAVRIEFAVWILTDGEDARPEDRIGSKMIKNAGNFKKEADGSFLGTLKPNQIYEFEFASDVYELDWTSKTDLIVRTLE